MRNTSYFPEPTEPPLTEGPSVKALCRLLNSTGVAAESSDRNDDATSPLPPPARQPDAAAHLGSAMHQNMVAKKTRTAEIGQFKEQMVEQVEWNYTHLHRIQYVDSSLLPNFEIGFASTI